jgi:uncharacterized protein with von Willebrand factor type A (vWA) domain
LLPILGALIVAGAVLWAGQQIVRALSRPNDTDRQSATLLALFAPAVAAAITDPRAVLAWQPLAVTARTLHPREFAEFDRAFGSTFPFSPESIERAHARWTADWLAWERRHDAEFKLKAATVEHELGVNATSPFGRARLDAVEQEKLDLYQQHYEEYTRIAKGLQALIRR